ncbi:MAG: HAMP domain-containing histidine kinase [Gammaproteobacteria bacterium]|nr:HAMP domain-containing histidine kinase [Gammaproteobacteria bacterium]
MGHNLGISFPVIPANHDVAVLGHELANVLNGILGMAELLGNSGLSAEQQRWLGAIENSGRQMQALIQSVNPASAARAESGNRSSPSRVDGVELVEQVLISHTPAARSRKNRLLMLTHPDLSRHWFLDACLIRQVLDNLVGNAIKFTSSGVICIEAAAVPGKNSGRESLCLRVSDSGPGVDAAAAQRIFTAYAQLGGMRSGPPESRGLGLYICRKLVKAMQGCISCSSPEGGGALFEVIVPEVLGAGTRPPAGPRSKLLTQIFCQLNVSGSMGRSVSGFLARLGIRCGEDTEGLSGAVCCLVISEDPRSAAVGSPGLLLSPLTGHGQAPECKALEAPVLESSLGRLLLEFALEWRMLALRNENRD